MPVDGIPCFDERENLVEACPGGDCLPLTTQRIPVDSLANPFLAGWCRFDLAVDDEGVSGDIDFPGPGGTVAQGWVASLTAYDGTLTAGSLGVELASACGEYVGNRLFSDDFEAGDPNAWSSSVP